MKSEKFIKSILGEELFESLKKSLEKIPTSSVIDLQEMNASFNMAPKALVAFLIKELRPLQNGETKEIKLPFEYNSFMLTTKHGPDVYSGHLRVGGKIVHEFRWTAIPQLAAHIMSTFELHDESNIFHKEDEHKANDLANQIQDKVDQVESKLQDKVDSIESKLTGLQIQLLENKINELMRLVADSPAEESKEESSEESSSEESMSKEESSEESSSEESSAEKTEPQINIETLKSEPVPAPAPVKAASSFSKQDLDKLKSIGLKKAGVMPKMPSPPKAGSMGGVQGGKTGLIGNKTPATDSKVTQHKQKNPYLKAPKTSMAAAPKMAASKPATSLKSSEGDYLKTLKMSLGKSENSICPDCGQPEVVSGHPIRCACFQALSEPTIKKSENGIVSVSFKKDWDSDNIEALYKSLMRRK